MTMTLIHATCFFLMLMLIIGYPSEAISLLGIGSGRDSMRSVGRRISFSLRG